MIVATAGHIDHGKTLLVKTLTGVDTDRLPEEKARGISIDLGFAYLPIGGGGLIGFVDVPGHEKFIRNMLAGVCGIDFALLVVAADDGVMPQTLEHLRILDLLQVRRGAVVITKIDRVDAERVREVRDGVAALLTDTVLAGAPMFEVSAVQGTGIRELRDHLIVEDRRLSARHAEGQHFRLAVDRAFSVSGSGTVLTGTVFNGALQVGDKVVVSPSGEEARVRGIQIHGKATQRVGAGMRCAVNLARIELEAVHRGDWLLAPELHRPTARMDVRLKVLEEEAQPVRHWMPVHLHLATSDVTARVAIRRGAAIAPGETATVQLLLSAPIGALRGDRIILRDQSASRTIGGGIVLDPFAPATRRSSPARLAELEALAHDSPAEALAALVATARPIDRARFEVTYNLTRERAARLYADAGLVTIGQEQRVTVTRARYETLRSSVVDELKRFHQREPRVVGMEVEALRRALAPDLQADAFASVLRSLVDERRVEASGSTARIPGHVATANDADDLLWQQVLPAIQAAGHVAPSVAELADRLQLKEAVLKDFLHRKARTGEIRRVTADRYFLRSTLADLAAAAQALAESQIDGRFTAAQYRDATGIGRNHTIELLEFFDSVGISRRLGNLRRINKESIGMFGVGTPPARPSKPPTPQVPAQTTRPALQRFRR